jgi:threonyl-tRNA synthetase
MFQENKFKTHLLQTKVPDGGLTSVYRIGEFVDLCTGPHIAHTGLA